MPLSKRKKTTYYLIDPGGNVTALVEGKFSAEEKKRISKRIFAKHAGVVEQVGFFWKKGKGEQICLSMAGGEFCGNATRALGFLHASRSGVREVRISFPDIKKHFVCTVSKDKAVLHIPRIECTIIKHEDGAYAVSFPGILHSVLLEAKHDEVSRFPKTKIDFPAVGFISVRSLSSGGHALTARVLVKNPKTLFDETSCASGTVAAALSLHAENPKKKTFSITQPSGSVYVVTFLPDRIELAGPVWELLEGEL